jgi:hypothetical protein
LYLPEKWALRPNEKTTAKKSYEKLVAPYKRERATELQDVAREFSNVRLRHGDSVQYCMEFWAAYYKLQDVTEMFCEVKNVFFLECVPYYDYNRWIPLARYVESGECLFPGEYVVPKECTWLFDEESLKHVFFKMTFGVKWLKPWRRSVEIEEMTLWDLVMSLSRKPLPAAVQYGRQRCTRCKRHVHRNRECFKQHPELR